jgi:protein SCO1/2
MNRTLLAVVAGVGFGVVGLAVVDQGLQAGTPSQTGPILERFPNVLLQTHDGRTVRFYDDLIKGKIVAINFMYVKCKNF